MQKYFVMLLIIVILLSGCTSSQKSAINYNDNCIIKGNISYNTQEKIYHVPGCENYDDTVINTDYGEQRFCSEQEALNAGRRKAKNCQ